MTTEIRPIKESEAEIFLNILCDVFDLDYARAHSIFFTEPLYDVERKWALFHGGEMVSILTTVPLVFGWGRAIGVAGVATRKALHGQGFAGRLLDAVMRDSERAGEGAVMLFARDTRLYERLGFQEIDRVIRGPIAATPEREVPLSLEFDHVQEIYDRWANANPDRLRRDALRWKYWKWNLRVCTPFHDGYMCFEGGILREVVSECATQAWELPVDTEWLGLASMAERLGVQLCSSNVDLHLMGHNVPGQPQFFMTDQF